MKMTITCRFTYNCNDKFTLVQINLKNVIIQKTWLKDLRYEIMKEEALNYNSKGQFECHQTHFN